MESGVMVATLLLIFATVLILLWDGQLNHGGNLIKTTTVKVVPIQIPELRQGENQEQKFESKLVVELTKDNFDTFIKEDRLAFVHFHMPWCVHCQRLAPSWEKLAEFVQKDKIPAVIAEVDCMAQKEICQMENIKYYPNLLWYNGHNVVYYHSDRDSIALRTFVLGQVANRAKTSMRLANISSEQTFQSEFVVDLTEDNYDAFMNDHKLAFVFFYAPCFAAWCRDSLTLARSWKRVAEELNQDFQMDKIPIAFAQVDCIAQNEICHDEAIVTYPTIQWHNQGEDPVDYVKDFDFFELQEFVYAKVSRLPASIQLTNDNVDTWIKSQDLALVQYYFPQCPACYKLAPRWWNMAMQAESKGMPFGVAKFDCFQDLPPIREECHSLPNMVWYESGKPHPIKYDDYGGSVEGVMNFAKEKLSSHPKYQNWEEDIFDTRSNSMEDDTIEVEYLSESWDSDDSDEDGVHSTHVFERTEDQNWETKAARDIHNLSVEEIFRSKLVVDLIEDNFDTYLREHQLAFVYFYTPWVPICQIFALKLEDLAEDLQKDMIPVSLAKVDCTTQVELCRKQNIEPSYLRMRLYDQGEKVDDFEGIGTIFNLKDFILKQVGSIEDKIVAHAKAEPSMGKDSIGTQEETAPLAPNRDNGEEEASYLGDRSDMVEEDDVEALKSLSKDKLLSNPNYQEIL